MKTLDKVREILSTPQATHPSREESYKFYLALIYLANEIDKIKTKGDE
jgi:hypothetical protein